MKFINKHITTKQLRINNSKGDLYAEPFFKSAVAPVNAVINVNQLYKFFSEQEGLIINNFSKRRNTMEYPEVLPGGRNAKQVISNKKSKNKISKRSSVMQYATFVKTLGRGISALFILALMATIAFGQSLVIGNGSTYTGSNGVYKIKGDITNNGVTGSTVINGTVNLIGAAQNIGTAANGTIGFGNLSIQGTGTKTSNVTDSVLTAIDIAGSDATAAFNLGTNKLYLYGTITKSGSAASTPYTFNGTGAEVLYSQTSGTQEVWGTPYDKLTFAGSAIKDIPVSTTATVNSLLAANSNMTITGTLTLAGSSNANIAGNFTDNGAFNASSGTVTFNGAAQTIAGSAVPTFTNLTIAGSDVKTASQNVNVSGLLIVDTNFVISGTYALTMQSNASASYAANLSEVIGNMTWQAYSNKSYTFNNAATSVNFGAADPSRIFTINSQPNVFPDTVTVAGHTVKRNYTLSYSGWTPGTGSDTVVLQLGYKNSEVLGAAENKLNDFQNDKIDRADKLQGRPVRLASGAANFGYVTFSGLAQAQLSGNGSNNYLALDDRFTIYNTIAGANRWNNYASWDAQSVPTAQDEVVITTGNPIAVTDALASAYKVTINSGLTVNASSLLTVGAGGLTNSTAGTLNVLGTGGVAITGGNLANNGAISNAGTITVQ